MTTVKVTHVLFVTAILLSVYDVECCFAGCWLVGVDFVFSVLGACLCVASFAQQQQKVPVKCDREYPIRA